MVISDASVVFGIKQHIGLYMLLCIDTKNMQQDQINIADYIGKNHR